jgi:hypothetical protein
MIQRVIECVEMLNGKAILNQERQLEALYRSVADNLNDVNEPALAALRKCYRCLRGF